MFCKTCGSEINDNAVVCPKCGCMINNTITQGQEVQKKKINVLCLVGFILSLVSLLIALFGTIALTGLILSIIGVVQAVKKGEKLKGLGIAGIAVSAGSLIYTFIVLVALAALL